MSLEGLLKELDDAKKREQDKQIELVKQEHEAALRAKDQEIASLKEEIETLRNWLDHSALPAFNPISDRSDSMGLVKMNFGEDRSCPDLWSPGEKALLDVVKRRTPDSVDNPEDRHPIPDAPPKPEPTADEGAGPEPNEDISSEEEFDEPRIPGLVLPESEMPETHVLDEGNAEVPEQPVLHREGIVVNINEPGVSLTVPEGAMPETASREQSSPVRVRKTSFPKLKKITRARKAKPDKHSPTSD